MDFLGRGHLWKKGKKVFSPIACAVERKYFIKKKYLLETYCSILW